MISTNIKRARAGTPNAPIINTLSRNIKCLRDMRPMANVFGTMSLPWGQALIANPNANSIIAFTDAGGITRATRNGNGPLTMGMGMAYQAFPQYDPDSEVITLDYVSNRGNSDEKVNDPAIRVYNLAANADGAVAPDRWIIATRIFGVWVVTWEECPDS